MKVTELKLKWEEGACSAYQGWASSTGGSRQEIQCRNKSLHARDPGRISWRRDLRSRKLISQKTDVKV